MYSHICGLARKSVTADEVNGDIFVKRRPESAADNVPLTKHAGAGVDVVVTSGDSSQAKEG